MRFRDSLEKLFILLKQIRYIIKNIRDKKNSSNFVFSIIFNSKNADIAIIEVA